MFKQAHNEQNTVNGINEMAKILFEKSQAHFTHIFEI
jgi:hypothetical protein